jgi:hypothetical protein
VDYFNPRIDPYLPSVQSSWTRTFSKPLYSVRPNIPYGSFKSLDEFNWYDGKNPRFRHPYALFSPGHAELDPDKAAEVDRILYERDKDSTFLLVDSGGFQVGRGLWSLDSLEDRIKGVIKWQESIADLAVILEVPAWMERDGVQIPFEEALSRTNQNLRVYRDNASRDLKFLIPLHGDTFEEGRRWFEETRWFCDEGLAVGWCFASKFSGNLHLALQMLLYMLEQDHYPEYLHFLGQGTVQAAIIAAIMRRTVVRAYPEHVVQGRTGNALNVTIDASSDFQSAGRFLTIYERGIDVEPGKGKVSAFQIKSAQFNSKDRNAYPHNRTYPDVGGPILGKYDKGVVVGDLLSHPNGKVRSKYNIDEVTNVILIAHNVWVKLDTIERMGQLESGLRRIAYGKMKRETYEFADMVSRLMHKSTNKGRLSDLGHDLVTCTVGLWETFRYFEDSLFSENSASDRRERLQMFQKEAKSLFGKV